MDRHHHPDFYTRVFMFHLRKVDAINLRLREIEGLRRATPKTLPFCFRTFTLRVKRLPSLCHIISDGQVKKEKKRIAEDVKATPTDQ